MPLSYASDSSATRICHREAKARERSDQAGGGCGRGYPSSHGRELFYFDACDRTISCIPLVYFVDLKSLHNSENIVLLKE